MNQSDRVSFHPARWLLAVLLANCLFTFSMLFQGSPVAPALRITGLVIFVLALPGVLMAVVRLFWRRPTR